MVVACGRSRPTHCAEVVTLSSLANSRQGSKRGADSACRTCDFAQVGQRLFRTGIHFSELGQSMIVLGPTSIWRAIVAL